MLGMGRFGSITGSMVGGLLLAMGWGFTTIIPLLAIPAVLAALAVLRGRRAAEAPARGDAQNLAHT
jgi:AAHS family 4-hydroxybenzoate transporter-like MFS transporter